MICYEINSPQIQLHCCYANALHWYGYLQQMASMHVDQVISLARAETLPADAPSEYLRSRCPLCFGGDHCHDESFLWVSLYILVFIYAHCLIFP
jgi:hypothetical protein